MAHLSGRTGVFAQETISGKKLLSILFITRGNILMFKKKALFMIKWTLLLGLIFLNLPVFAQENQEQIRIERLEREVLQLRQILLQQSAELAGLQRDLQLLQTEKMQMKFAIESLKQQVRMLFSRLRSHHAQPKIPLTFPIVLSLTIPPFQVPMSYLMFWL